MRRPIRRHRLAERWYGDFRPGSTARFVALGVAVILLSAAQAAAQEPPSVVIVGDSVPDSSGNEIAARLEAEGRSVALLTAGSATIDTALAQVRDYLEVSELPPIWIVMIGHAQVDLGRPFRTFRPSIRRLLETVAPEVDCLRWFELGERRTAYPEINAGAPTWNRVLGEEVPRFSNAEVFHYQHWARLSPRRFFIEDGVHHTTAGSQELARLVAQAADGCDPAVSSGPYWDVRDDAPVAGSVAWVRSRGLMRGFRNGTFRATIGTVAPRVDRGTVADAAWRLAGSPRGYPRHRWSDVPRRLRAPLSWVDAEGLAAGRRYFPRREASRAHTVRLLWAASGEPRVGGTQPWVDAPRSLRAALRWLASTSDRALFPGNQFHPNRSVSRAQLVRLLAPAEVERGPAPAPAPVAGDPVTERIQLDEPPGAPPFPDPEVGP